jgi:putative oxygen-independent coproporphyrinogen III oxidase
MTSRTIIPIVPIVPIVAAQTSHSAGSDGGLSHLPPLSLYIHIPWCVRKCPYCDFNSHEARGPLPEDEYIAALIADLEQALPQIWGRRVVSIFIGGGTPSLLSVKAIDTLLTAVRARLPLLADAEITLEANPGTVEAEKFAGYRSAGINRISLGIQSFSDPHLHALGRIHNADEARRAVDLAQRHFEHVNLDLMYALPRQTLAEAQHDLTSAVSFGVTHLSAYHLTLEPNTAFHHAPPPLPDDDLAADMQDMVEAHLAAHGYAHYETSAYARPGHRCTHNLNYWGYGDYLGIGAGAHGKISSPNGIVRETRRRHPRDYLTAAARGEFIHEQHPVPPDQRPFEFMMNALRLHDGFNPALFEAHTGCSLSTQTAALEHARRRGLLEVSPTQIAPTAQGRRFLNDLLEIFLTPS